MSVKSIDRRTLLRGTGVALGLPLLEAMLPTRSAAAAARDGKPPLRMVYLFVPNGMHMPDWKPKSAGALRELPPTLKPLEPFKQHVNVLTGLTLDGARAHGDGGGDHARAVASFLTGSHPRKTDGADILNRVSVDQVAAEKLGKATRFASLELGLEGSSQSGQCDSGYSCAYSSNMSWRNETTPVPKETDPAALFDRLFSGQTSRSNPQAKDWKNPYRKSVLDLAMEDAGRLRKQIGQADQRKLDEYLYAIRDVEKRIAGTEKLLMSEAGVADFPRPAGIPKTRADHAKIMLDLMTLAMQTDSTRIMTFMFRNAGDNVGYPELNVPEGHHDLSHHGGSEEKQKKIAIINKFHVTLLAHFLERVSVVPEGAEKLIDHCMIMYGSGISDGDRHNHDDLPILLAGGAGGKVKGGRHLIYPDQTPLCNLHLWMLRKLGIDQRSFGDSTGIIDQLENA
jgi:hypothetical protein